jgi:signal transduction histidine kinase
MHLEVMLEEARDGIVAVPVEKVLRLREGGRQLGTMISDLLDATLIDSSRLSLAPEPVSLPDAIAALLDRIRPTLGDHLIDVVVLGRPSIVMVDRTRLDQIVTNLVENAAKYSPDGAPIRIEIRREGEGSTLAVRDRGYGIAPEELPRLFERFARGQRARAQRSGLGLGLHITKGLVEAHGGQITVDSKVDRGSTFSVWLPSALLAPR